MPLYSQHPKSNIQDNEYSHRPQLTKKPDPN